jgi:soluble lytic murein transglycosylase
LYALYGVLSEPLAAIQRAMYPLRYEEAIREVSRENGLEPAFVAAVIYAESRFRQEAVSHKGAHGLMQITPPTASFIRQHSGIAGDYRRDPFVNLQMGVWYLAYLEDRYLGDERLMLAAYNSGVGSVDGWLSDEDFDIRRDIPFKETREYVSTVLEARSKYEELYGRNLDRDT